MCQFTLSGGEYLYRTSLELWDLSLRIEGIVRQQVGGSFSEVHGDEDDSNGGLFGHRGAQYYRAAS